MIGVFAYYMQVGSAFFLIGGIYGLALGVGLAILITISLIKKSNDIGASQGTLSDFGYLDMLESEDDLCESEPDSNVTERIMERHKEEKVYYPGKGIPGKEQNRRRRLGDGSIGEEKASRDIFTEKYGTLESRKCKEAGDFTLNN